LHSGGLRGQKSRQREDAEMCVARGNFLNAVGRLVQQLLRQAEVVWCHITRLHPSCADLQHGSARPRLRTPTPQVPAENVLGGENNGVKVNPLDARGPVTIRRGTRRQV
jgi:hypothetical protein